VLPVLVAVLGCAKGPDLADTVASYAGNPYQVEQLDFTFVVEVEGEEKVRRTHRWQPMAGALTVEAGESVVSFVGLRDAPDLSAWVEDHEGHAADWARFAPDADPEAAAEAWARFVNDSYWLLAPSKVLDPGVVRTEQDGVLALDFEGVGITPGDHYELTVDSSGKVTGWTYTLQGGREGAWTFEDYRALGPLNLSLRRVGETAVIWFDDVSVR